MTLWMRVLAELIGWMVLTIGGVGLASWMLTLAMEILLRHWETQHDFVIFAARRYRKRRGIKDKDCLFQIGVERELNEDEEDGCEW